MCVRVICSIVGENFSYYTQQSFNTHKHTHTQSDTYTGAAVETDEKQFFCMKAVRARLYEYVTCAVLCCACVLLIRVYESDKQQCYAGSYNVQQYPLVVNERWMTADFRFYHARASEWVSSALLYIHNAIVYGRALATRPPVRAARDTHDGSRVCLVCASSIYASYAIGNVAYGIWGHYLPYFWSNILFGAADISLLGIWMLIIRPS